MSLQTSSEHPAPVRTVSTLIGAWVRRLGPVWVEGQLTSVRSRPGTRTAFLTLRDPDVEMSLTVTCPQELLDGLAGPRLDGARVVVHARPDFYPVRGTLSLAADAIRPVGLGELLARLEALKRVLAAEGLFEPDRKLPLPFLPRTVGLVCGRESAAERDVVDNATRRWPAVRFEIRRVAVQGPNAVSEVVDALVELDARPEVDVIVVARGGGSVEDLLPFSAETLLRTVAGLRTPLVSAIGHETDSPLLDLVADVRASTPTDAARRIVPDLAEEQAGLAGARARARAALAARLDREQHALDLLRTRPVLAQPRRWLQAHADEVRGLMDRARRAMWGRLDRADDNITHLHARLLALSPAATLARGYAVLTRHDDGRVVRRPADAPQGTLLIARLAHGRVGATSAGSWDE